VPVRANILGGPAGVRGWDSFKENVDASEEEGAEEEEEEEREGRRERGRLLPPEEGFREREK
jgi:hypothetical protein